jgi:hypothetical protein
MIEAMLGPVSSATRDFNPWFPIIVGTVMLLIGWTRYLQLDPRKRVPLEKLIQVSIICAGFVGLGLWRLLR